MMRRMFFIWDQTNMSDELTLCLANTTVNFFLDKQKQFVGYVKANAAVQVC